MDEKKNEIILFENQGVKLEVNLKDETVWLTQEQMSKLFGKAKSTINEHIKNVYKEGELIENETMTKFGNSEFADKPTNYYNLDMIISVGYRVKSQNGILFRKWATSVLKDYMLKGYAVNQKRLEYLEKIEEQSLAIFKIFIKMKNYLKVQYAHFLSILLKMVKNIMYNITI